MCYNLVQKSMMINKRFWAGLYVIIIVASSAILTILSMWLIENVPGNSFKTNLNYILTALLVFVLWCLTMTICVWFISFLNNLLKLEKNPYGTDVSIRITKKNRDLKTISIVKSVVVGILNAVCIYVLTIFSISACIVFGFDTHIVIRAVFVLANFCIILLLLVCAISDLIMAIKIKHNQYDQKAIDVRKKGKKFLHILLLSYVLLYALAFAYLSLLAETHH